VLEYLNRLAEEKGEAVWVWVADLARIRAEEVSVDPYRICNRSTLTGSPPTTRSRENRSLSVDTRLIHQVSTLKPTRAQVESMRRAMKHLGAEGQIAVECFGGWWLNARAIPSLAQQYDEAVAMVAYCEQQGFYPNVIEQARQEAHRLRALLDSTTVPRLP
jgi:hypothetical protein